ncbi:hypothetical protein B5K11_13810 [Rhizobium leguminosarum bv. trifolii]|uniref:hypothetical protein n=1 Tax=Rhizobium leguminosarum TaxID=384 RepID=UPI000E2EB179|nr:hypothetical protein [Rhizobium leguminosarum]RFB93593.1 hypothetical protein B5K11_13810 [Rhizobium leguminosarum bv. trifolii]
MFHHKKSFDLSIEAIADQCCEPGVRKVGASPNRMQFVNDHRPKKASQKLDELLQNLNLPRGEDRQKFFRVVDFHGMSVSSEVIENQLLNVWISLETITPSDPRSTKIDNVTSGITPFIGLNYTRRLFERLAFDLIRWNRPVVSRLLKEVEAPRGHSLIEKIARLIVLEKNEPILAKLLAMLEDFELLRFRTYQFKEQFKTPKKVIEYVRNHQCRVEWQIRRIYRTRNAIVHSGETPEYTQMLVENAHDYFDQVFELSCKLCSGGNGFYSFKECFDYTKWQYGKYMNDLAKAPEFDQSNIGLLLWGRQKPPSKADFFADG